MVMRNGENEFMGPSNTYTNGNSNGNSQNGTTVNGRSRPVAKKSTHKNLSPRRIGQKYPHEGANNGDSDYTASIPPAHPLESLHVNISPIQKQCVYRWNRANEKPPKIINVEKWGHVAKIAKMSMAEKIIHQLPKISGSIQTSNEPVSYLDSKSQQDLQYVLTASQKRKQISKEPTSREFFQALKTRDRASLDVILRTIEKDTDSINFDSLKTAIAAQNVAAVYMLCQAGMNPDHATHDFMLLFEKAIEAQSSEILTILILFCNDICDIPLTNAKKETLFHIICKNTQLLDKVQLLKVLLNLPFYGKHLINSLDIKGVLPIIHTIRLGDQETFQFLIGKRHANIMSLDYESNNILHWICFQHQSAMLDCLLNNVAVSKFKQLCEMTNVYQDTPLHYVMSHFVQHGKYMSMIKDVTRISVKCIGMKNKNKLSPMDILQQVKEKSEEQEALFAEMVLRVNVPITSFTEENETIVNHDLSGGRENRPIRVVSSSAKPDMKSLDFRYTIRSIRGSRDIHYRQDDLGSLNYCDCVDKCDNTSCDCRQQWIQAIQYVELPSNNGDSGMGSQVSDTQSNSSITPPLSSTGPPQYVLDIDSVDLTQTPHLFECGELCRCSVYSCKNRLIQRGMQYQVEVFYTSDKGWGVRAKETIPRGAFVGLYAGEIISEKEANNKRSGKDDYFFELKLPNTAPGEDGLTTDVTDAMRVGNFTRFFNHLCSPNIFPIRVYLGHKDARCPDLAFFTKMKVNQGDELGFDYGDGYWVPKALNDGLLCKCGMLECKYDTLEKNKILSDELGFMKSPTK